MALCSCAGDNDPSGVFRPSGNDIPAAGSTDRQCIVASIFPAYDWTMAILGEDGGKLWDVRLLLDNGTDMHSYQPTADDIIAISDCDILIYVGGESDEWIEDALANASNPDMTVVCLMDILGDAVKEEELAEGMQEEKERLEIGALLFGSRGASGHSHGRSYAAGDDAADGSGKQGTPPDGGSAGGEQSGDSPGIYGIDERQADGGAGSADAGSDGGGEPEYGAGGSDGGRGPEYRSGADGYGEPEYGDCGADNDGDETETEYDEHVWLSLRNAALFCGAICDALSGADTEHADIFINNREDYVRKLELLDESYSLATSGSAYDTLLFADRFPFRYLVDDYGLSYYAAFPGCSADSEASFETIIFLAGKLDELGLPCVLTIESSDTRLADTIISCTASGEQSVLRLNSMQSVKSGDIKGGISYLGIMEDNLSVLCQALDTL